MGVVGPRHQLGKTMGVVAAFPQHSKGQAHTLLIPWHSRTLIPRAGAQHLPHSSSEQLSLVEQQCQPCQGHTKAEEPRLPGWRGHTAVGSAPGNAHTSPRDAAVGLQASSPCSTCSKQSQFALKTLLLEQFQGFKQTPSYELNFYAGYFNPVSFGIIQSSALPPRLLRGRGSSGSCTG